MKQLSLSLYKFVCMGLLWVYLFQCSSLEAFAGAKALGMGITGVAYPQDSFTTIYNPAGMAEIGDRFDVEASYVRTRGRGEIRNNANPLFNGSFNAMHKKDFPGGSFSVNKQFLRNFSIGLTTYGVAVQKTTYRPALLIFGQGKKTGFDYAHLVLATTLAMKVHPCHSFGISFDYRLHRLKSDGLQNADTPEVTAFPGHVTNRGYNYASGIGVSFGWLGHFTRYLSLGIFYTPKTYMDNFNKYKGSLADKARFHFPSIARLGIAFTPLSNLAFTFDFEHIYWRNANRAVRNPVFPNTFLYKLGTKNAPGFGWRDQNIYRFGVAYGINDQWTLRAGYDYGRSPTTKKNAFPNLLVLYIIEHIATLGTTYAWDCKELSFYFQHGFENKLHGRRSIPTTVGGGDAKLKASINFFGITYGQYF